MDIKEIEVNKIGLVNFYLIIFTKMSKSTDSIKVASLKEQSQLSSNADMPWDMTEAAPLL